MSWRYRDDSLKGKKNFSTGYTQRFFRSNKASLFIKKMDFNINLTLLVAVKSIPKVFLTLKNYMVASSILNFKRKCSALESMHIRSAKKIEK